MSIEDQSPGPEGPIADQPRPFSEQPQDAPGGCSRPLLAGCGVAVVLLGLLLLGVLWKARDLMPALFRWSLDQFEQQITGNLPADLSEEEGQRLADAFDGAAAAVEEGTADPVALQRLQGELLDVVRGGRLDRNDVLGLIEALEAVAGARPPPAVEPSAIDGADLMPVALWRPSAAQQPPVA